MSLDLMLTMMRRMATEHGPNAMNEIAASQERWVTTGVLKKYLSDPKPKMNPVVSELYNISVELLLIRGESIPNRNVKLKGAWLHHKPTPTFLRWLGSCPGRQSTGTIYIGKDWMRPGSRTTQYRSPGPFTPTGLFDKLDDTQYTEIDFNEVGRTIRVVTRIPIDAPVQPKDVYFTGGSRETQHYTGEGSSPMEMTLDAFNKRGYKFLHRPQRALSVEELDRLSGIEFTAGQEITSLPSDRVGIMCGKTMIKERGMRARDTSMIRLVKECGLKKGDVIIIPKASDQTKVYQFQGWKISLCPDPSVVVYMTSPMNRSPEWIETYAMDRIEPLKQFVKLNGG